MADRDAGYYKYVLRQNVFWDRHYQDNRVEYFFHHVPELVNAGVIGLLFGAGNGGSTVNYDGKHDGVTNPPSFCS